MAIKPCITLSPLSPSCIPLGVGAELPCIPLEPGLLVSPRMPCLRLEGYAMRVSVGGVTARFRLTERLPHLVLEGECCNACE